jgi:hypothetical protein
MANGAFRFGGMDGRRTAIRPADVDEDGLDWVYFYLFFIYFYYEPSIIVSKEWQNHGNIMAK